MEKVKIKLDKDSEALLKDLYDFDGIEVPQGAWEAPNVKPLIEQGLAEFSGARGPGNAWKRLTLTEKGTAFRLANKFQFA